MSKRRCQQQQTVSSPPPPPPPEPLVALPHEVIELIHEALLVTSAYWGDLVAWHSTCQSRWTQLHCDEYARRILIDCITRARALVTRLPTARHAINLQKAEYALLVREVCASIVKQLPRKFVEQRDVFLGSPIYDTGYSLMDFAQLAENHPCFAPRECSTFDSCVFIFDIAHVYLCLNFGWNAKIRIKQSAADKEFTTIKFPLADDDKLASHADSSQWQVEVTVCTKKHLNNVLRTKLEF